MRKSLTAVASLAVLSSMAMAAAPVAPAPQGPPAVNAPLTGRHRNRGNGPSPAQRLIQNQQTKRKGKRK